jgi:hypothetical protein
MPLLRILAPLLCLSLAGHAAAQTTAENLQKYWDLRQRATTEYIHVGVGAGESFPATYRNSLFTYIKWSDATVHLGWYIAVLATELQLLSDPASYPGYDGGNAAAASETLDELHRALTALERVDTNAELAFPLPCWSLQWTNGFFIRDDVPLGFESHFPPMALLQSDFTDIAVYNKEMSQDQVIHVMMGLAAVKRFVPPGTVVQGTDLRLWAVDQASRIMTYVATTDDWQIQNPVCGKAVDRGADARPYSYGLNETIGAITDGALDFDVDLLWETAWWTLGSPANPAYLNADNLHMAMVLAAVGDGFGSDTLDDLMNLAATHDWYLYVLLHAALFDPATLPSWASHEATVNGVVRAELDELPIDAFPASPQPFPPAVHGWTTDNRFIRESAEHYQGGGGSDGQEYNGLDYQLLHNLYYLVTPGAWDLPAGDDDDSAADDDDSAADDDSADDDDSTDDDDSLSDDDTGDPPGDDDSSDAGDDDEGTTACRCMAAEPGRGSIVPPLFTLVLIVMYRRRGPARGARRSRRRRRRCTASTRHRPHRARPGCRGRP